MAKPTKTKSARPDAASNDPLPRGGGMFIGDTGLRAYGGYVSEEFVKELKGAKGRLTYREMADNDPTIGAMLFAITMLLRQVKWSVQPAGETAADIEAQEFVESILDDMENTFQSVIEEICTMFPFGFAPLEITWKRRVGPDEADKSAKSQFSDGLIGIRELSLRGQNSVFRWQFNDDYSEVLGMWQQRQAGPEVFIPMEKLLLFRTSKDKNNPEGRSILRNAYRPWYFKKRIEEIEGIGIERDLAGLPVAKIPSFYMRSDADEEEKAVYAGWKSLVTKVRRDQLEGLVIPSDKDKAGNAMFEFDLLNSGGRRNFDTTQIIDRYDRRIATTVLADFIFLGQQKAGSFALSSDKTELFATAIGGWLDNIAATFNRGLIPLLWRYNGLPYETMPTLVPGDIEKPDIEKLGSFIGTLTGAGMQFFPDRELENSLREKAGLPPAPEDADWPEQTDGDQPDEEDEEGAG